MNSKHPVSGHPVSGHHVSGHHVSGQRLSGLIIVALAFIITLGCSVDSFMLRSVNVGDLETESIAIAREDAARVRAYIRMGAGELTIDEGADDLMEADFTWNVTGGRPEVNYEVRDAEGRLTVRQPSIDRIRVGSNMRYEWNLRFGDDVPLDMRIEVGAGRHDLDLSGLNVTELDLSLGAGDVSLDVSNNADLARLDFDMGAGNSEIDLAGPWHEDADINIQGGVGRAVLLLPSDVGVRVEVSRGFGDISTTGLHREGNAYVNDAYGESDVTLEVNIRAGVGRIELDVQP